MSRFKLNCLEGFDKIIAQAWLKSVIEILNSSFERTNSKSEFNTFNTQVIKYYFIYLPILKKLLTAKLKII